MTQANGKQNMIHGRERTISVPDIGILRDWGVTVPADGSTGYAPGCIFQDVDASEDSQIYINAGTVTSSDFNAIDAGAITAADVDIVDSAGYFTGTNTETVTAEIGELLLVPSGTAAGAGPSPLLWDDCPILEMMIDPTVGYYYFDDFMGQTVDPGATASNGGWTVTRATSGTIGSVIGAGGELHLSAGASTDDQGINAQLLNCAVIPTAAKTIWFEARVQVSNVDNQVFVGMASTQTAIIASGALDETTMSAVGFFTDVNSTATKYGSITSKAGNNDTTEDIGVGLAATTWAKLGIKITGITQVEFFYDGVVVETGTTTASIADAVEMALSLVCQSEDGTSTNTLKVDWVRVAQLR